MKHDNCDKMIMAILQGSDYRDAIKDLNDNGFYATVLNSTGGFLRKQSVTIMIGLNHVYLDEALEILDRFGKRTEMHYPTSTMGAPPIPLSVATPPVPINCGGAIIFVLDIDQYKRI